MMKILYICTHNRCRSILSEAITNGLSNGLILAKSAGSEPAGEVHFLSIKYLEKLGYSTDGLESQSWDDFEDFEPDLVVTVCDSAAGESCPTYFGKCYKIHWGLNDPSKIEGSDEDKEKAFMACIDEIVTRVEALKLLVGKALDGKDLQNELNNIGKNT